MGLLLRDEKNGVFFFGRFRFLERKVALEGGWAQAPQNSHASASGKNEDFVMSFLLDLLLGCFFKKKCPKRKISQMAI